MEPCGDQWQRRQRARCFHRSCGVSSEKLGPPGLRLHKEYQSLSDYTYDVYQILTHANICVLLRVIQYFRVKSK